MMTNSLYNMIKRHLLEMEKTLYLKESTIAEAGSGVFSHVDIPKGKIIAEYRGKTYSKNKILSAETLKYSFIFPDDTLIVPYHDTIAKYINDTIDLRKTIQVGELMYTKNQYNVRWYQVKDPNSEDPMTNYRLFIITTKSIKKGEELFIDYGHQYWMDWVTDTKVMIKSNNMLLTGDDIYKRIIHLQRLSNPA